VNAAVVTVVITAIANILDRVVETNIFGPPVRNFDQTSRHGPRLRQVTAARGAAIEVGSEQEALK
jgi:hypothetical protein